MTPKTIDTSITEFGLAVGLLVRRIRAMAPTEQQELTWTQKAVIKRLAEDGAATTAELARSEGVKPQSMGTAIAGLEEGGWVERKAHPTDGRQMNIQLTAKGRAMRKSSQEAKHTWLAQAIGKLTKEEQVALFAASEIIKKMVEV